MMVVLAEYMALFAEESFCSPRVWVRFPNIYRCWSSHSFIPQPPRTGT